MTTLISGLGSCLFAQKPMVSLMIDDKDVAPNESVTITVTTNLNGSVRVDYPSDFAVDYGLMHGMDQKMDASTGKIKTYYYMRQSGAFLKEGSYTFRAYVHYQGKEFASNKLTVKVSEEEEEENSGINSKEPVFGIIQAKKSTVYEGEPVLLRAKVFSRYEIYFLDAYKPFTPDKNAEEHVFPNELPEVEETRINGKSVLTFDYGKQLIFPISTGKCKIRPFEMALRCRTSFFDKTIGFKSASTTLIVKPLPDGAPKTFIGAVGKYALKQELGKTSIKQGDVFSLTLVVSGLGNLHNINEPVLSLPKGCSVYGDPERKENFQFTEEGVEGSITYIYNIQVSEAGDIRFPAQAISYFDPEAEKYVTVLAAPFQLDVAKNASFQPIADHTGHTTNQTDTGIKPGPVVEQTEENSDSLVLLVGIGTPVLLLGAYMFLFIARRRKKADETAAPDQAIPIILPQVVEQQQDYWQLAFTELDDPNQFAVLFPKAIIQRLERFFATELTREKALAKLADYDADKAREIRHIIDTCDHYRYGFGASQLATRELMETTASLLAAL